MGNDGGTCPSGLQCNVTCSNGGTTSISGKVYDPAGKNPLYGITVFVPETPLQPLPKGVPTGADACSCDALYKSGKLASTRTAADGSFKLTNAPVGTSVPLVAQVGKWRRQFNVNVTACQDNPQPDKSLALPSTISQPGDNMPDIAVSTGSADTLECLFLRVGLPASEYVAGTATTGHVHVFSGGSPSGTGTTGAPEMPAMPGATASSTTLWDSQAHLMPYDLAFLSCEGGETYAANPQVLEDYVNAGGRVYATHYHYSWLAGPIESGQAYAAPADWGSNLASWTSGSNGGTQSNDKVVQTLNGSTAPFPKGQAFYQWLGVVGALGMLGAPASELPVIPPRFNAVVAPANKPSQPWLTDDSSSNTMLFTFDTPVNAPAAPDGGPPAYCGRVAYGDVHAGGETTPADVPPPPGGCTSTDLSPQEKALEFMLFDLSSCVLPDSVAP
jgi:hypothetical protein